MAIKFGLTNRGYIAPTFAEWLDDIEDDFRSRFGDDIVITSNSNFGFTKIPTSAKMRNYGQSPFAQRESELISNQPPKGFYNSPYVTGKRYSKIIPYNSSIINKLVDLLLNW